MRRIAQDTTRRAPADREFAVGKLAGFVRFVESQRQRHRARRKVCAVLLSNINAGIETGRNGSTERPNSRWINTRSTALIAEPPRFSGNSKVHRADPARLFGQLFAHRDRDRAAPERRAARTARCCLGSRLRGRSIPYRQTAPPFLDQLLCLVFSRACHVSLIMRLTAISGMRRRRGVRNAMRLDP